MPAMTRSSVSSCMRSRVVGGLTLDEGLEGRARRRGSPTRGGASGLRGGSARSWAHPGRSAGPSQPGDPHSGGAGSTTVRPHPVKPPARRAETPLMVSSHRNPRPPRSERTDIVLCALMLALITVLRMAICNPIEAVGFLYVIPISLLASERGLRGGLLAAAGAIAVHRVLGDGPARGAGHAGLRRPRRHLPRRRRPRRPAEPAAAAAPARARGPARRAPGDRDPRPAHGPAQPPRVGRPARARAAPRRGLRRAAQRPGDRPRPAQAHQQHARPRRGRPPAAALRARVERRAAAGRLPRPARRRRVPRPAPGLAGRPAEQVARRILGAVPFNQTCSIGFATWDGAEPAYELVHRADQGMYAAKAAGGGRIDAGPVAV